jgi:hypothetical protein
MEQNLIRRVYLLWQSTDHSLRHIVGELIETNDKRYLFRYVAGKDLDVAKALGFSGYPAFPDLTKEYSQNVIESFAMRLPSRAREDFKKLLAYWDIHHADISDFDLLAITGGQLKTDRFEFIDPHEHKRPNQFLTELAGYTHYADDNILRNLPQGTVLDVEPEPANKYDPCAVKVLYGGQHIGYIKKVHSRTVAEEIKKGRKIGVNVNNANINGVVNSILLKVSVN